MFRSGFARCPLDGTPLQELVDDPLAGSMFADRYVIERCIGEGGMGRVYRARHQRVSRRFAIKVLYGDHATDPKMRDRFAREAEAASRLDHPNVISVVDFGETEEGLLYLVMDFVEGRELAEVVGQSGALSEDRVERILRGLCKGLSHAHGKDLVHRDFKGENVILTGEGDNEVARIVDFGIAFMLEAADVQRLTTEGMVLGTPAYMSPEQATGAELDHRTDLFSLGVMLYEMLAGVLPFEGPPLAIARQNLAVDPPPISERVPGLSAPPRLEAIAMKLMAKKPEDRYQSAQEVLNAIDAIDAFGEASRAAVAALGMAATAHAEALEPVAPSAPDTTELVPRRGRARWLVALLALIAGGVTTALVVGGVVGGGDRGDDPREGEAALVIADADAAPEVALAQTADAAPDPVVEAPEPPADDEEAASAAAASKQPARRKPRVVKTAVAKPAPPKADATKPAPPEADVTKPAQPKAAKAITTTDLTVRYKRVGEAIEGLARKKGAGAVSAYRARYSKIPFADALRTPSLRAEVDRQLRRLESQVEKGH